MVAKPHARGDGPVPGVTSIVGMLPSPTHVGMDRLMEQTGAPSLAKPHARGDGPLFECGPGLA